MKFSLVVGVMAPFDELDDLSESVGELALNLFYIFSIINTLECSFPR